MIPGFSLWQMGIVWAIGGVIAFVTGSAGTAIVQGWLNKDNAKAEAARMTAAAEKERQDARNAEIERIALIQEVEKKAHDTASAAANEKYGVLEKRCVECVTELNKMQRRDRRRDRIEDLMLDAMVEVVPLLQADAPHTEALRAAIKAARQARYELDDE